MNKQLTNALRLKKKTDMVGIKPRRKSTEAEVSRKSTEWEPKPNSKADSQNWEEFIDELLNERKSFNISVNTINPISSFY